MTSGCVFCGNPHFNFGDDEEGIEMWINEPCERRVRHCCRPAVRMEHPDQFLPVLRTQTKE